MCWLCCLDGSVIDTSGLHHSKLLFDRMEEDVLHYKGAIRNRMGFEVITHCVNDCSYCIVDD